ncbi:hypothetical protein KFL_002980020 [Klebsormidium nitens]|uniref:Uncharacterized protein n=1 Tax=Klebsormidium nitens TaxID=105231 RepID=A0A1Y1IEP3_KLENI|nr:hypothetical protein KFL_002980020 [Klebsormidium nitens]|eukprot:GAQ86578.1 hypothetical protein KFL_002980020 [Klebsormidium nitens]
MALFTKDCRCSWVEIAKYYQRHPDGWLGLWLKSKDGLALALGFIEENVGKDWEQWLEPWLDEDNSSQVARTINEGLQGEATVLKTSLPVVEDALKVYAVFKGHTRPPSVILGDRFAKVVEDVLRRPVQESLLSILIHIVSCLPAEGLYDPRSGHTPVFLDNWLNRSFMEFVSRIIQKEVTEGEFDTTEEEDMATCITLTEGKEREAAISAEKLESYRQDYLDRMEKDGAWGTDAEVLGYAHKEDLVIIVEKGVAYSIASPYSTILGGLQPCEGLYKYAATQERPILHIKHQPGHCTYVLTPRDEALEILRGTLKPKPPPPPPGPGFTPPPGPGPGLTPPPGPSPGWTPPAADEPSHVVTGPGFDTGFLLTVNGDSNAVLVSGAMQYVEEQQFVVFVVTSIPKRHFNAGKGVFYVLAPGELARLLPDWAWNHGNFLFIGSKALTAQVQGRLRETNEDRMSLYPKVSIMLSASEASSLNPDAKETLLQFAERRSI